MIGAVARKLFGSSNDRRVRKYQPRVDEINALEPELIKLTDDELRARTEAFKKEFAEGKTLDDLLVPAFATVREAAKRAIGQRHFDVQLIGGMILHEGKISEMKTGEGKTLVATLAVYLNALASRGVHVVTVNDYLAKRDSEWMGQIYGFLGLKTGVIVHGLDDEQRKAAYDCDVTYGTNNELGFDYLRDNMKYRMEDMVQRGHTFAIVDEVDFDPDRRGAHAADHLRPARRPLRFLQHHRRLHPEARQDRLRRRREAAHRGALRSRHGEARAAADRGGPAQGRVALRRRERLDRPPRQPGAARPQAVHRRQGLHRAQRRGRHHRRVHRPHDAGPPLFGRAAPGAGGERAPADPAGEPDARLDHVPELLPHVREARRHDRHGADRSRRVHGHLQPRRRRGADQPADDPRRPGRRGLSHRRREIPRHHHAAGGVQAPRPAGAGRHHLDREVRKPRRDAAQGRLGAARLHRPERLCRALQRRRGRQEDQGVRHPERALPRAGGLHRLPGRRAGRDHHRHQHGRPRHRHSARRQRRHAHPPGARRRHRLGRARQAPARRRDPRAGGAPERDRARRPAACSCSAPSVTRAAASTTSFAAAPAARAIRAAPSSSCRSKTT